MIQIHSSSICKAPREKVFKEFSNFPLFYLQLSPGHKQYKLDGKFAIGAHINVLESAGFQRVEHNYEIKDIAHNERIALTSPRSKVLVMGMFRSTSSSHVDFLFKDKADHTEISLSLRIHFSSPIRHILARLFLTNYIWALHARNEMNKLAQVIEERLSVKA